MKPLFAWLWIILLPFCVFGQTNYQPYTFTTLAGSVTNSGSANGIGSGALFSSPHGVATDAEGNIYVAELGNSTIRKITPAGLVSTVAGLTGVSGTNDGVGSAARFKAPWGVAVDAAHTIYVADTSNHTVRVISPSGVVSTLAGLGGISGTNDGVGAAARFNFPFGVVLDKQGNIYVSDQGSSTIRRIAPGGVVTTLAGAAGKTGITDATGSAARFKAPAGIVVNSSNVIFVNDEFNHTIRAVTTNGVVTTFAGLAGTHGLIDATGTAARFYNPNGLAIDAANNLYVAEFLNDTVRKITPAAVVATLAGWPQSIGSSNGTGSNVRFNKPRQLAVDHLGNLYVADLANQTIRKGWSAGTAPLMQLTQPVLTNGLFLVRFTLLTGASASFDLLQASQLGGLWATNLGALLTTNVPGVSYQFSGLPNAPLQFFRVQSP